MAAGTAKPRSHAEFAIDFAEPRQIDPLALTLIIDVCPRAVYELASTCR